MINYKQYQTTINSTNAGLIKGYASVFNNLDKCNDIILPGAFDDADNNKIKFLWQHKPEHVIGKITKIEQDDYGLFIEAQLLLSIDKAKEIFELIKQDIITQFSIGYRPIKHKINAEGTRIISSIELLEIILVTFPANENAIITQYKTADEQYKTIMNAINRCIAILQN